MVDTTNMEERLTKIGIAADTIKNILKNKNVTAKFAEVLDIAGITECPKEKGALLYAVATKVKPLIQPFLKNFVMLVAEDKWTRVMQLDEGIKWMEAKCKQHGADKYVVEQAEFEQATGVGINVTTEMIEAEIDKLFSENAATIKEQGHEFNFATFQNKMKDLHKWADGGAVRNAIEKKKLEVCGEPEAKAEGKRVKPKATPKPVAEEKKEEEEVTFDITKLISRDVDAGNSSELLEKHRAFT